MEPISGTFKNSDRRAFGPCPAIWSEAYKVLTTEQYYRLHGTENLSTKSQLSLTFLNKHLIILTSLKERVDGNSLKISDCQTFHLF